MNSRFRFVSDDDGHDYLIPEDKLKDWWEWLDSEELICPEWAERLDWPISDYSFENVKDRA